MRTTIDLPDALLIRAKVRAAKRGEKLKDVIAEAIEQGFAAMAEKQKVNSENAQIVVPENGSLACVVCEMPPGAAQSSVDEILRLEQETLLKEDMHRAGITD